MALVSVTRFRSRAIRFVPLFAFHARRTIAQIRKAEGYLTGTVRCDRNRALWTMTVWRDERAMLACITSGAHRSAMPHLRNWGIEASVVRWVQCDDALPDWHEAIRRMRAQGRASSLRHPGPAHADLTFPDSEQAFAGPL